MNAHNWHRRIRFFPAAAFSLLVLTSSACATTSTQLAPVAPEAVKAEERTQRELVLQELEKSQKRLDDLAFPLLEAATPLCKEHVGPRLGVRFASADGYDGVWQDAARAVGLTDTLTVVSVAEGSPAQEAGLRPGQRLIQVGGAPVSSGAAGANAVMQLLQTLPADSALRITVLGEDGRIELSVRPRTMCDFDDQVAVEGGINAFADGKRVIVPWAMMRFAQDDELQVVVSHEIAHDAMGHMQAKKKNAVLGAIFGAVADAAMASQGVNTGGAYTSDFSQMGAQAFSQDFEREADYVGMYILARAGVPLDDAADLWRHFAQIDPSAIGYASSHPTTAERFVRLRQTAEEIRRKREAGEELMPEMKGP